MSAEPLHLLTGYQVPAIVTAAQRVGLFDAFGGAAASAETIAERIATAYQPTRALLDSLVAIGLVQRTPEGYTLAPQAAADLGRHGALARVVDKEAVFARLWLDLDQVIRTGTPLLAPWRERLHTDPEGTRAFSKRSMCSRSAPDRHCTACPNSHRTAMSWMWVAGSAPMLGSWCAPDARSPS
jgi:hypothetical protein